MTSYVCIHCEKHSYKETCEECQKKCEVITHQNTDANRIIDNPNFLDDHFKFARFYGIKAPFSDLNRCKFRYFFSWSGLGRAGNSSILSGSYYLLFIIPLLSKIKLFTPFADYKIEAPYLFTYFSLVAMSFAHLLFGFFAPRPMKRYADQEQFFRATYEVLPGAANELNVRYFWDSINCSRFYLRSIIAIFYLLGFLGITWIFLENTLLVIETELS